MNEARLLAVADRVRERPEEYDQRSYGHRAICGTVACLGGTACLLFAPEQVKFKGRGLVRNEVEFLRVVENEEFGDADIHRLAQSLLGLDDRQAERLFSVGLRWPSRLNARHFPYGSPAFAAHVADVVIPDFIRTNGWEGEA